MRIYSLFSLLLLAACAKKTVSVEATHSQSSHEEPEVLLLINEYSPKSNALNEFNEPADWIELYNASGSDLAIAANTWSITDDTTDPHQFWLPAITVPANGYLVIWCDGRNLVARDIHANFKLSGKGEEIALYRSGELMDEVFFDDDVKKDLSYGRIADGSKDWITFQSPSPGSANASADNYAESLK